MKTQKLTPEEIEGRSAVALRNRAIDHELATTCACGSYLKHLHICFGGKVKQPELTKRAKHLLLL